MTAPLQGYCALAAHPTHAHYHDHEYGFPNRDDRALFELLALEINQAGLSWALILQKRAGMREAFDDFDIDRVAAYDDADRARLMQDARVIRNRLKIDAVIENARRLQTIRERDGSFAAWLDARHPLELDAWTREFKRAFKFTGGEVTREFLVSTGYLPGAHDPNCPAFARILALEPPWARPRP